jgi:hypothetical protein
MITYTTLCFKSGVKCYQKVNVLTRDELDNQLMFWNVNNREQLLQRWNQQCESIITGLKWIYY